MWVLGSGVEVDVEVEVDMFDDRVDNFEKIDQHK
jgi:hypothetical protein